MPNEIPKIQIQIRNADQVSADLALLSQAAEACLELRKLLLDLGDLDAHLCYVYQKDLSAVATGELFYHLEFSDALAGALAAVRARGIDHG